MVVGGVDEAHVDEMFRALADPIRRDIFRRCQTERLSVSQLAQAYPMSFAAVQRHVAVLEHSGLVTKQPSGRERLVHTDLAAIDRVREVLDELAVSWRGRADRMAGLLAQDSGPGKTKARTGETP